MGWPVAVRRSREGVRRLGADSFVDCRGSRVMNGAGPLAEGGSLGGRLGVGSLGMC